MTFHSYVCYSKAVWAGVSASLVGATEERLTVAGKIKMSDLYWRWGTKPCSVILVTRTTERITPVHAPSKQIQKVIAGGGKNLSFGLKLSGFDSSSEFKPFLKISAQNTLPIKRKISRKKCYLLVRLQGCHFLTHYSMLSSSAPHPCSSSHPRMSLHRSTLLGRRAEPISRVLFSKSGSRTPSRDLPLTALVLLWVPVVNLYFLLSEANLSVIHLASLKPKHEDLAEFCSKKDHSAAHNCSSRGSLNTRLK